MVNGIISNHLKAAGLPNILEPSNLINSNGLRPYGVTLVPYKQGRCLTWDFTCPHPLAASHLPNSNVAESAEITKIHKYRTLSENYIFSPIAIDTMGGYGPAAK